MLSLNDYYIRRYLRCHIPSKATTPDSGRLLDVGCGQLPYASIYEPYFRSTVAVDIAGCQPVSVRATAVRLPFRDEAFECVLMTEVLEHIERFDDALSEVCRVISPGGRLIVTWPLSYQLHDIPQDYWRFTEFAIGKMLCDRGFQVENLFRRGDLSAVMLAVLGTAVSGGAEALRRVPKLGWMLRIVASAADWALSVLYRLFVLCSHRWRRLNPVAPGESLRGLNALALWTLGYCAVARKVLRA